MKTRYGFVSNSSSSSFTCLACGETVSGWDMCLKDAEMSACQKGHLLCDAHKDDYKRATLEEIKAEYAERVGRLHYLSEEGKKDKIENMNEVDNLVDALSIFGDEFYEGPDCDCPFCTMQEVDDGLMLRYLLKESNKTEDQLINEIKQRFNTREDANQYLSPSVLD